MANAKTKPTVYRDADETILTDQADIVSAYRQMSDALNGDGSTAHVDDTKAWELISAIPGQGGAVDEARANALFNAPGKVHGKDDLPVTPLPKDISAAATLHHGMALRMSTILNKDQAFSDHMDAAETAKETSQEGPLVILRDWKRLGIEVADMPTPGTGKDQEKNPTNNPDFRQIEYTKANGESGKRWVSMYEDTYDLTTRGKRVNKVIEICDGLLLKVPVQPTATDLAAITEQQRQHIAEANGEVRELGLVRSRYNQRRTTGVQTMKKARKVALNMELIAGLPESDVRVWFAEKINPKTGKKTGELLTTNRPIVVCNGEDYEHAETFSITSFLTWKPLEAKEYTKAGLKATAKRAGNKKNQKTGASNIPTLEVAESQLAMIGHGLVDDDWHNAMVDRLKAAGSNDFVLTMGRIHRTLAYLFNPKVYNFQKRYEDLEAEIEAQKARDAAAKAPPKAA